LVEPEVSSDAKLRGRFSLFPSLAREADAARLLSRHWGGWAFVAINVISAVLAILDLPGTEDYAGLKPVAAAYFATSALLAAALTWALTRRRMRWAGGALLLMVGFAICMTLVAASDLNSALSGPYLFIRLWICLSIINAIRACRVLKSGFEIPTPLSAEAPPSIEVGEGRDLTSLRREGRIDWHAGWRRVALLYVIVSAIAVSWALLKEPFWFMPCPKTYTVGGDIDLSTALAYQEALNRQRASGCVPSNPNDLALNRMRERVGVPQIAVCEPLPPPRPVPERIITRSNAEVTSCTFENALFAMRSSPASQLLLWLISIPIGLLGLLITGRWLWRGFRPTSNG
jgi:hypothetical protein